MHTALFLLTLHGMDTDPAITRPPAQAAIRFHKELAQLLRCRNNDGLVHYAVTRRASIKDVIEALGPPHSMVGSIHVNTLETGFGHLLRPGESVDVFPHVYPRDVTRPSLLRPTPLPQVRFLADANVGKLAQRIRLLGFDTAYDRAAEDSIVALQAAEEGRIILSKDRGLLKRSVVVFAHLVQSEEPDAQLREVLAAFGLRPPFAVFSRCLRCNTLLEPISKEAILHRLLPLTKRHFQNFKRCPGCDKIYWAGSHHEKLHHRLAEMGVL